MRPLAPISKVAVLLSVVAIVAIAVAPASAPASASSTGPVGAWYLALDSEPFGLPAGTFLSGLASFQFGGTFQFVDTGDFGGAPFFFEDSPQVGAWRRGAAGSIVARSLFLQADASNGEMKAWNRVELVLYPHGHNRMTGHVNVFALDCDLPAPFGVFACPDPIANEAAFAPASPPDVPVEFTRLSVR